MASTLPIRALRWLRRHGFGRLTCTNPARVFWRGGVISFTFDDFPRSALTAGGAILERHGGRGTYYTALDLAGTQGMLGPMFEPDDVGAAHRRGHEIACHTFRHVNCAQTGVREIVADIADNAAALAALIEGFAPVNFAYPYGELSLGAKRALGARFWSCRGITEGFNCGMVDLAELRVTAVHASGYQAEAFCRLIDRAISAGGWLIFYTHDVSEAPSPFGCTPEQLEAIVSYAAERAPVLTVRDVVAGLGLAEAAPARSAPRRQDAGV
jgi:peptidoglycan/xylan/chitin deacetylase (PgdA/CDA1 family)